jgi:hypothetical protein
MNDIIIRRSVLRRELRLWLILLLCAIGVNIYAIIIHDGRWSELITQFHIVFMLSIFFYVIIALPRGIYYLIRMKSR